MRRFIYIIVCTALALSLCSCASFREISTLQVIETLGFDREQDGETVSASGGAKSESTVTPRLTATAGSITEALARLQDYSPQEELFYCDAAYFLLGEDAAADCARYLDFALRSVRLRTDTPIFIVRGGRAGELVMEAGGEVSDISQIMASLSRDTKMRVTEKLRTAGELALDLERSGASLVPAIAPGEIGDGEDTPTALFDGFAIIKDGSLCGYFSGNTAVAAAILQNSASRAELALPSGAVAELTRSGAEFSPVWSGDGMITGVEVKISLTADIVENAAGLDLGDGGTVSSLEGELETLILDRARDVLAASSRLGADFLSLGREFELKSPREFRSLPEPWETLLTELEFSVSAEAEIHGVSLLSDAVRGGSSDE